MSKRFPQPLIDKIVQLLRTTDLSLVAIARECGTSQANVIRYAKLVEPQFKRLKRPPQPPEIQIAIVADAISGFTRAEIASRAGVGLASVRWVLSKHAETIEAARAKPAPVAKPSRVSPDWIAEDPALKRSIDRLRAFPRIIPVSEFA